MKEFGYNAVLRPNRSENVKHRPRNITTGRTKEIFRNNSRE